MKPSSDLFRPKLPSDPFLDLDIDQPWHIVSNNVSPHPPQVILVFGAPSQADLRSLLTSQWLGNSLVLIATHSPPSWNGQPVPTVRILRLLNPLEDGSGRELANLFESAERLAHQFRSMKLPFPDKRFAQLAEKFPGCGDFTVLEDYTAGHVAGASRHASLAAANPSKLKRLSVLSNTSFSLQVKEASTTAQQRTLDAILYFIPPLLSEKDIYKRAILVTTLSLSFLSAPLSNHIPSRADPTKHRFSSLLRSKHRQSLYSDLVATETPAVYRPHLVLVLPKPSTSPTSSRSTSLSSRSSSRPPFLARHISPSATLKPTPSIKLNPSSAFYIPPLDWDPSNHHPRSTRPPVSAPIQSRPTSQQQDSSSSTSSTSGRKRLAQSVEQFLIQFAYPAPSSPDDGRSIPYLLSPDVFSRPVQGNGNIAANNEIEAVTCEGRLTVGEAILLGLLDAPAKGDGVSNATKSFGRLATRAWIAENQQVALLQTSTGTTRDDSLIPSPPPSPLLNISAPAPTHRPSGKEKEWDNVAIRDETCLESQIMKAILSPHPYPSFQNTPLPWSLLGTGSQSDEATIEKPAPVIPRMLVPLSPPLSKSGDPNSAPIEASSSSSLAKLASESVPPSASDNDGIESLNSHLAKSGTTDHSWPGVPVLLTPPESSESSESSSASVYESCEVFSATEHGVISDKTIANEHGPFVLFRSPSVDGNLKNDADGATKESEGLSLSGRIGHQFRRLSKVMSMSGTAAVSMSSMALSTVPLKVRVGRRERRVLQTVVV